ncbi:hypothetical protein [Chryseobacterium sp. Leaf394]|uniref:hypothetical protein n=1 Tax=Chryseobacterium sp. Leaf394 TaxID=1736361 RepID=UPI0006FCD665|nr:hypothetical protein [Chryseobacterium sp. Leaf394]KQS93006.1 hypothetical protein ASG21_11400 [Chryseobacterium sp. Leaf394]
MGNILNCIKLDTKIVDDGKKVCSILRNDVKIVEGIPEKDLEKYIEKIEKEAKKALKSLDDYLDELSHIKNGNKVSGIKFFTKWFDEISLENFLKLWGEKKLRQAIQNRIRHPGGLHEWLMVSRADTFKKWNVSMVEIKNLRTKIEHVIFKNPPGVHGGLGSTTAHNEILELIDSSKDFKSFKKKLINWSNRRLEGGAESLPKGFFD